MNITRVKHSFYLFLNFFFKKVPIDAREFFIVDKIKLEGNEVTKEDIFEHYLSELKKGGNLRTLFHELNIALYKLQSLGIFQSIDITFQFPSSELESEEIEHRINLLVKIKEKHRRQLTFSRNWMSNGQNDWVKKRRKEKKRNLKKNFSSKLAEKY